VPFGVVRESILQASKDHRLKEKTAHMIANAVEARLTLPPERPSDPGAPGGGDNGGGAWSSVADAVRDIVAEEAPAELPVAEGLRRLGDDAAVGGWPAADRGGNRWASAWAR
jgi:hypothetical protein